jgi:C4-dicarboxylate transporter DctQ subunit
MTDERTELKKRKTRWLKFAEGVSAAMLAALFLTFVLQIFSRYVLAQSFGWTVELCLTLWVWIIFWGNAFVVKHDQHVSFDMLYLASGPRIRRLFSLIGAASIAIAMAFAVLPTLDYIDFMNIQKSATLQIPLRSVFSIFGIFVIAVAIAYAWRFIQLLRSTSS